jgi:hypothetical protein
MAWQTWRNINNNSISTALAAPSAYTAVRDALYVADTALNCKYFKMYSVSAAGAGKAKLHAMLPTCTNHAVDAILLQSMLTVHTDQRDDSYHVPAYACC